MPEAVPTREPEITEALVAAHGLKPDEHQRILDLLGRTPSLTELLTLPKGPVNLSAYDTGATPGFEGGKSEGKAALAALEPRLSKLQEMLFASQRSGRQRLAGVTGNPNLAGGYMMTSFFVLLGSPWPRRQATSSAHRW